MSTRQQFTQCSFAAAICASSGLAHAQTSEDWKSLFDGKTLKGWKKDPRIYVHGATGDASMREAVEAAIEKTMAWHRSRDSEASRHLGDWYVVDGAIVGGQDPPGSRLCAYLMMEETFGDFELEYEMRPDWQTDTGVLEAARHSNSKTVLRMFGIPSVDYQNGADPRGLEPGPYFDAYVADGMPADFEPDEVLLSQDRSALSIRASADPERGY